MSRLELGLTPQERHARDSDRRQRNRLIAIGVLLLLLAIADYYLFASMTLIQR